MTGPGRVALDDRTRVWRTGDVLLGGSPWGVVRIAPAGRPFVRRLQDAGGAGVEPDGGAERAVAARLVDRGLAHPVPTAVRAGEAGAPAVEVVVPCYGRADLLDACLASLVAGSADDAGGAGTGGRVGVVVVDDCSPTHDVARVAAAHGARVVRHPENRGPGAARNTGLAATTAPVVAFVDADVTVTPGWLDGLLPLFDDPRVGAVAPRVLPRTAHDGPRPSLLARHELARSALDMGRRRELVRPGAPLGFLPSATLLVRRDALAEVVGAAGFEESMRVGEDVDLVWRLVDAGRHVRYEPTVQVHHEMRLVPSQWARRRFEYGTSAATLDRRHPGRLAPARPSAWNLAVLGLLVARRPVAAAVVGAGAAAALARRLSAAQVDPAVAGLVVAKGVVADGVALGHALRREWWPLGWTALAASVALSAPGRRGGPGLGRRTALAASAAMLGPVALEWVRNRPDVDPARYALLRLAEDAAYGSGVLASAVRDRRPSVLRPEIRLPRL